MSESKTAGFLTKLRRIMWPIEGYENKKFIPMALMMACILFNYATVRSIKDGLVVTNIGTESVSFLKLYLVLPSALIFMILYAKLCNIMSQQKVFYTITMFFILFFALFTFVLYPNPDLIHPSEATIAALAEQYPNFKWFIRIAGKWSFALFYMTAEIWGSMMLTLLFWQFANQITKTEEAKRFYSMFGMIANIALLLVASAFSFLSEDVKIVSDNAETISKGVKIVPILSLTILSGLIVVFLYNWINRNVLTDPRLYDAAAPGSAKKKKAKLSLGDSFKMILTSKYLGLLVILVIAYGVSINLVEGVWKDKIKQLYPTAEAYTAYMGTFQAYQGITAIFFMLVGSNILRTVSWTAAAMLTPVMILITGLGFFAFIFFDQGIGLELAAFFGTGPLALAVMVGMAQNVLSKATKYSLFDSTKEMAYIPLDDEMKSKGKAAVDVVGGRLGKSGGAAIQSTLFMLIPSLNFAEATPYFAGVFFVVVILWIFAVKALGREYAKKLEEKELEQKAA
jgi:AAA family ATP:ADP antiporter